MRIHLGHFVDSGSPYVRVEAPAKLNLFLEVLGEREDGFHQIETLMCPISLCDHLLVESVAKNDEITLELELPDLAVFRKVSGGDSDPAWKIPSGEENLVVRAVRRLRELSGCRDGIRIRLDKQIPAAAGLAGGSSDVAAALVACSHLWGCWDRDLITQICAELGSDIAFFLGDEKQIGMGLAQGRGEVCVQLESRPNLRFLVLHPPEGCPTGEIYQRYQSQGEPREFRKIVDACEVGQVRKIGAELFNALQFPASRYTSWIDRQLDFLRSNGFEFVLMSGSGSSCFGLFLSRELLSPGSEEAEAFSQDAKELGIDRVYDVEAWYAPSIERQLFPDQNASNDSA